MNRLRQKTTAIVLGLVLAGIAWAGLETVTHIQDLNSSWPLGSDLASTSDDHIRNIKVALKTDFPNFNGTYTSASAPVFAIPSDTNTGMYSVGADDLGFSSGGTLRFDISTTAITSTIPHLNADGTNNAPAFSFSGDSNTGMYRVGADIVGFTVGGTRTFTIYGGATPQTAFTDGTASLPPISFDNDSNTGFYRDTADQIAITLGGTTAGQIAQGSGTVTVTGCTTSPTPAYSWQRVGKLVMVNVAAITCTSNATTFTLTGLASVIRPASTTARIAAPYATNNGAGDTTTDFDVNSSGVVTFYSAGSSTGWAAANTKAYAGGISFSYLIL